VRGEYFLGNYGGGNNVYCFKEQRGAIKSNNRLARRVLMMAYKADGAIVVVGYGIVVMNHRHDRGQQENQYEERCKTFGPAHRAPFTRWFKLSFAAEFVKKLFVHDAASSPGMVKCLRTRTNWALLSERHTRIGSTTSGIPWL
jgi:hypothetical protein